MIQNSGSTQPSKPITPKRRGRVFLFNTLILLVILAVVLVGGYQSGVATRKQNQTSVIAKQLTEQFQFANDDLQAGRYEIAKQRLEFIINNDPSFPGAQEKLTQVLVLMNAPTPTAIPSLTLTPDLTGINNTKDAFLKAQQLIAAQDWTNALGALDQLRKLDPTFQQSQVDGMYYFALRNYGYDLITKQGNLEGGIYQLTLAERFGQLDRDANGIRDGARVYIIGASFWQLNWQQALFYFDQARNWGNLWDGTMTAADRYKFASMRYGDELFAKNKICEEGEALVQYQNALTIGPLDKVAQHNYESGMLTCHPPTEVPSVTATLSPIIPTDTLTPIPSYP